MRQRRSATVTFASDDFASFAPSSHPSSGLVLLLMSRCRWSQNKLRNSIRVNNNRNTTLKDRHGGEQTFCIFIEEKDGKSERYAMIFIADSTPPSTLCPCSNGSAVLKSWPKFFVFKINIIVRYLAIAILIASASRNYNESLSPVSNFYRCLESL